MGTGKKKSFPGSGLNPTNYLELARKQLDDLDRADPNYVEKKDRVSPDKSVKKINKGAGKKAVPKKGVPRKPAPKDPSPTRPDEYVTKAIDYVKDKYGQWVDILTDVEDQD